MTGEDHTTDALIAALRSPALPAEQVGEAAVVTAMIEARTQIPAASHASRSRRGVTIAAVTVASLGLGGLVAAGPGIFLPAADRPGDSSTALDEVSEDPAGEAGEPYDAATATGAERGVDRSTDDPDVECADGNHGRTVSSVARSAESDEAVSEAARSECGKPVRAADGSDAAGDDGAGDDDSNDAANGPEGASDDPDVECADGNHGRTVSSVAQATESGPGKGAVVSEAARSDCGKSDDETARGSDEAPGESDAGPGKSDEAPGKSETAPGHTDETPGKSETAPGHTDETPGKSETAPGHTDDPVTPDVAPGQTDEAPGNSGAAPGKSGQGKP